MTSLFMVDNTCISKTHAGVLISLLWPSLLYTRRRFYPKGSPTQFIDVQRNLVLISAPDGE